jgi:hypothetical protein
VTCSICEYAAEHAAWPPDHQGTHCRDCHRSWTSKREAHCVTCHEHFGSNNAADQHWLNGRHVHPDDLPPKKDEVSPRLVKRDGGVWVQPMDEARLESLRSAQTNARNSAPGVPA